MPSHQRSRRARSSRRLGNRQPRLARSRPSRSRDHLDRCGAGTLRSTSPTSGGRSSGRLTASSICSMPWVTPFEKTPPGWHASEKCASPRDPTRQLLAPERCAPCGCPPRESVAGWCMAPGVSATSHVIDRCSWPPLASPYDEALREAIGAVLAEVEPTGIVATGTIVRGVAHASSDLDVFVIHEAAYRRRIQRVFRGVPTEIFINPPATV